MTTLAWTVIWTLGMAAVMKARSPSPFHHTVMAVTGRRRRPAAAIAAGVVAAEVAVPIVAFAGALVAALILADTLLIVFGGVAWHHRDRGVACSCFGIQSSELGWPTIRRNAVLIAVSIAPLVGSTGTTTVAGVSAGMVGALCLVAVELLTAEAAPRTVHP